MMEQIAPYLSAASTLVCLGLFVMIAVWSWSPRRAALNEEAARLPFELPDEYTENQRELS